MALTAAMVLPCAFVVLAGGVDYISVSNQRVLLQSVADRAALASAQELVVAEGNDERVAAVAASYVNANYDGAHTTSARVIENGSAVEVTIVAMPKTYLHTPFAGENARVRAGSVAEVSGGSSVCMIGLDDKAVGTIKLANNARVTAPACAIYSNSTSSNSIWLQDSARIAAQLVCSAGGIRGPSTAFTQSQPVADCPPIGDPLASRPAPSFNSGCDYNQTTVGNGETRELSPGVYCGGLAVLGGSATLRPGVYIMKNGPLMVTGGGSLQGADVGVFLTGSAASINFRQDSRIHLSAPRTGDMAGLLFFADRDSKFTGNHRITSRDARTLVGTMYFPTSTLLVDAKDPVADRSEYTIVIARTFELRDGPELVLNTDYAGSDVPVPEGLGDTVDANIRLAR